MKKSITKVLSFIMIFAMAAGIVNIGEMKDVNAADTTSAVQQIVVAAVTMSDAATREILADNITNIDADGASLGYPDAVRIDAITNAFTGVNSYLLGEGYVDAVIAKMDAQSDTSKLLIRKVIIEGAPTSIDYDRTGFKDTTLYNELNDMIAGGHDNDNGIKFLVKLFQSTAEIYNSEIAADAANTTDIKFEITGFHELLANELFSELMVSFETLNNMITNKAGDYATYTELLNYSAEIVNNSGKEAEFKRLLIANSLPNYPIYSGSVSLLSDEGSYTGGGAIVPAPAPTLVTTIDAGTVSTTTNEDGETVATVAVDEESIEEQITEAAAENVSLDLTAVQEAAEVVVELTAATIDNIADNNMGIEIETENAALLLPQEIIQQINQANNNEKVTININVVKTAPAASSGIKVVGQVLDFSIKTGDKKIDKFEKNIKAEIKADMSQISDYRKVIASYYNETSKQWEPINGYLNKATGVLTFVTNHFSKYAAVEYKKTFADVSTPWAKDNIEVLAARNIMRGKDGSKFDPKANITRAEVAAIIARALNLDIQAAADKFSDVSAGEWYAKEVEAAAKAGIIEGVGENKFAPEAEITREQIAVMIFRALEYRQGKVAAIPAITFTDASEISSYAKNAAAVTASKNIIRGSNNEFNPADKATREEVAVMLYRLLEALGEM